MARKVQHGDIWAATVSRALDAGGTVKSPLTVSWDASGKCLSPVFIEHRGAKARTVFQKTHMNSSDDPINVLEIKARCRKCYPCRQAKAAYWRHLAGNEIEWSERSWFGTLTINPHKRFEYVSLARLRLAETNVDFDALSQEERFRILVRIVQPDITKYWKRLRKNSGCRFKYLLVAEAHKDGFPHWHFLCHEYVGKLSGQAMREQWSKIGFAHAKIVDKAKGNVAFYVTKYITKALSTKVIASLSYGYRPQDTASSESASVKLPRH